MDERKAPRDSGLTEGVMTVHVVPPVLINGREPDAPRVVWRCPEVGCEWQLNTSAQQPGEADWRQLGKLGPVHYDEQHAGVVLPWELRAARDYQVGEPGWQMDVLRRALADVDRLGMYLLDERGEAVSRETTVDTALGLLREADAKPARIETSMQAAVRGDLDALASTLHGGARASLAALAAWLAEVIDKRGADAGPTTSARLAQELRATLVALTTERTNDPDQLAGLLARLSTAVGNAADAGPGDAGSAGGGDRGGAG
jgi:hypothetical protein